MARIALPVLLWAGAVAACSGAADAPAVATPSVTLSSNRAAIGSPLEMAYRFEVAADAPAFSEDYWVFVHFLDNERELMWTDDHAPPVPVRTWKPGTVVEYQRTMFLPKFPYVGPTRIEIGLFSPSTNERLPLAGETDGQRSYYVGSFDLQLRSTSPLVVFKDGWHNTETASEGVAIDWQWTKKDATLAFANPKRDIRLYLQIDQPVTAGIEPQIVEVRLAEAVVDRFPMKPGGAEIRRIDVAAGQLGAADTTEVTISVDKTFVPAALPALKSTDSRELGVRVLEAAVQAK